MRSFKSAISSLIVVSAVSGLAFFSGVASAKWANTWQGQQEQAQTLQIESRWADRVVADLNWQYSDLNLALASSATEASEDLIMSELSALDASLRGQVEVRAGSLIHLACSKPDCGGKN